MKETRDNEKDKTEHVRMKYPGSQGLWTYKTEDMAKSVKAYIQINRTKQEGTRFDGHWDQEDISESSLSDMGVKAILQKCTE